MLLFCNISSEETARKVRNRSKAKNRSDDRKLRTEAENGKYCRAKRAGLTVKTVVAG